MTDKSFCSSMRILDLCAVVLILLGMAFLLRPVIVNAQTSDAALCQLHLKQLGLGLIQYAQDNDNKWPGGAGHWAGDIFPYVISTKVYKCPSDPVSYAFGEEISYAMNTNLQGTKGGNALSALTQPPKSVGLIEYDGTPALTDGPIDQESKTTTGKGKNTAWGNAVLGRVPPTKAMRHDPYINVLACDGHVQQFLASEVSSGRDSQDATCEQTVGGAAGTGALGDSFMITFSEK